MPDLININTNQKAADINVPILRQPKFMALLLAYLTPTVKLQNDITTNYLGSMPYSTWVAGNAYSVGDRVSSGRSSYECIQANTNTAVTITNTNYWYKVSDDIIGLSERLNYNCQKMQLEFILNKRFNTLTNIRPPYNSTIRNIFITTNPSFPRVAWLGRHNAVSSYIKTRGSTHFNYHTQGTPDLQKVNYFINISTNLSLTSTTIVNDLISEASKYNAVGLTFDVSIYT